MAHALTFLELAGHVGVVLVLRGASELPFCTLGRHFGTLGTLFLCLCSILGRGPESFNHFRGKVTRKVPTKHRIGEPGEEYFDDILSFRRKWQTVFGLRLRGRTGIGASCFHSSSVPVGKHEK